jgi:two-component system phosphate regulon sensor histidine kinase PhoR
MLLSRLFWRIFITYAAVTLISVVLLVQVVTRRDYNIVLDQIRTSLRDVTTALEDEAIRFLQAEPNTTPPMAVSKSARANQQWIIMYGPDGHLLYDTNKKTYATDEPSPAPLVLQDLVEYQLIVENGECFLNGPTQDRFKDYLTYVRRLGSAEKPLGFFWISSRLENMGASISTTNTLTWTIAFSTIILMIGISYLVVARIIQPLEELTQAAQAIAEGDLLQQVDITNKDELGTLALAFNSMSEELASRIRELQFQGKQLQENSDRLSTILGGMVEGVIAVDAEERILFTNKAAFELIEFEGLRVVGRRVWEAIRNTTVQQIVRDVLNGKPQVKVELMLPRSHSTVIAIASRLSGNPCPGMVLVMHDITELRRLETMRKEFVSNVHHELKTPLASIQAYTETLLEGAIDDPDVNRHFLERIGQAGDRLNELIMDLLKLARIESMDEAFEKTNVILSDAIMPVIESHRFKAESRGIKIVAEPPVSNIVVFADPNGVRTILDNLLSNALKYSYQDGQIEIRWKQTGRMAQIEVVDHGDGIPHEHQKRIFERFYRVDNHRSREVGGTGLGLAIVKNIVQIFGGNVDVRSKMGVGSTFIVNLPLAETVTV